MNRVCIPFLYHPKINEGIQDLNTLTDIDCNNGNLNNEFYINGGTQTGLI